MNFLRSNKSADIQATMDWLFSSPASPYYCRSQCAGLFELVLQFAPSATGKYDANLKSQSWPNELFHVPENISQENNGNLLCTLLETTVNALLPTDAILITLNPSQKSCANSAIVEGCVPAKTIKPMEAIKFNVAYGPTLNAHTQAYRELEALLFQLFCPHYEDPNSAKQLAQSLATDPLTCFHSVIGWCKEASNTTIRTDTTTRSRVTTCDTLVHDVNCITTRSQQSLHAILSCSLFKMRYFKSKSDRNAFWYCHPLHSASLDWSAQSDGLRRLQSVHPDLPTLLHTTIFLGREGNRNLTKDALTCIVLPGYNLVGQESPTLGVMRWVSELMDYLASCARSKSEPNRYHVLPTKKPKTITGYPSTMLKEGRLDSLKSSDRSITVADVCRMLIHYHSMAMRYMSNILK